MGISDWVEDVCSSDIGAVADGEAGAEAVERLGPQHVKAGAGRARRRSPVRPRGQRRVVRVGIGIQLVHAALLDHVAPMVAEIGQQRLDARNGGMDIAVDPAGRHGGSAPRLVPIRSEEHTSELQSLMRISYAVLCLKKKKTQTTTSVKT